MLAKLSKYSITHADLDESVVLKLDNTDERLLPRNYDTMSSAGY